jgi:hypothetical protein
VPWKRCVIEELGSDDRKPDHRSSQLYFHIGPPI